MNSRQLTLLVAAATIIVLGAVWLSSNRNSQPAQNVALYPSLKEQLAKVNRVQIYKGGEQLAVQLNRTDPAAKEAHWQVKQRYDFPADNDKVNTLLVNLQSAKIIEQKTGNPDNYAALHVQDIKTANAPGVRVELSGDFSTATKDQASKNATSKNLAVNLIVGKQDAASHDTYVRRVGEAPSWLIDTAIDAAADPSAWLQRDALNIHADRIQEVIVELAGARDYSSIKDKRSDANFDVIGIPRGREINSNSAANSVAQSLVNLQLDDVRPTTEFGEKSAGHVTVHTFNGLILDIKGDVRDDKRWLLVKANFDEVLAKRFFTPTTHPAANKAAADKSDKDKSETDKTAAESEFKTLTVEGQAEADAINRKLGAWAIAVPAYRYESLFKPIEELLKKQEPKKELPAKKKSAENKSK